MSIKKIDGVLFRKMIISGSNNLEKNKEILNALNVFPVPDGDTGTNMSLTFLSSAKEAYKLSTPNVQDVAKAVSSGAIRGARGNSGVIVSQLFRGISKQFENKSIVDSDDFADALVKSSETAYKAVMKPKEGTILTVAREMGEKAFELKDTGLSVDELLKEVIEHGKIILAKTQEMLPVLKEAGVVDSGAKGLIYIYEGMYEAMFVEGEIELNAPSAVTAETNVAMNINPEDIKFGYCTEFLINVNNVSDELEQSIKNKLNKVGDSIVVVVDDGIIKIHVHTNNPGLVLENAVKIGELSSIKIENMREQHSSLINFTSGNTYEANEQSNNEVNEYAPIGFVSVAVGDGIANTFKELGAQKVIEGGQTINPSTEDILKAIDEVNADTVIVLPNNKNIILSAEQAANLCEDKNVIVIPTLNIPQGITALVNFIPGDSVENTIETINEGINNVMSGQMTFAVRDTEMDGLTITEGDMLLMINGKIVNTSTRVDKGAELLLDTMLTQNEGFVTIYYGEEVLLEEALELKEYVETKYKNSEVEVINGGQPLYYYIISVE